MSLVEKAKGRWFELLGDFTNKFSPDPDVVESFYNRALKIFREINNKRGEERIFRKYPISVSDY